MKKVNLDLLKQDIIFPLKSDCCQLYVWDNDHNMIAMWDLEITKEEEENFINKANKIAENGFNFGDSRNLFTLDHGNHIQQGVEVLITRGWGRLQYKDRAEERQDNISAFLNNCLNSNK